MESFDRFLRKVGERILCSSSSSSSSSSELIVLVSADCKVWKYPLEEDKENSIKFSYLSDGDELSTEGATLK